MREEKLSRSSMAECGMGKYDTQMRNRCTIIMAEKIKMSMRKGRYFKVV
jgi:hypothetical protein